uniref:Reverse transcriptase domain-containing protein n=1 Tax=Cannabis sativa TaxID=3483 RepID=A0A803QQW6_CANSA
MGDFNEIMFANERVGRKAKCIPSQRLKKCMENCDMTDLKLLGSFFTWNNKQKPDDRIFPKINRAMVNSHWCMSFSESEAVFLPELSFDHSPLLVSIYQNKSSGKKPFKYYNMWKMAPTFDTQVSKRGNEEVQGSQMYKIVTKLKRLKLVLKKINREGFSEIHKADMVTKDDLITAQEELSKNPQSLTLIKTEQEASKKYNEVHKAYSMFLSQKAKINWATFGDKNSAYFHASLKFRRIHNQIVSIEDEHGTWQDSPEGVQKAFLGYYEALLGTSMQNRRKVLKSVVNLGPKITEAHKSTLVADYTEKEVKAALFSIPDIKAPGSDGFGSAFYQDNWALVGSDFIAAILSFLSTGKMLKEINTTTITLIPKVACPKSVVDFRPISCCNVLYKTATKVICNRLKRILPDLIADNQGGFIHGRYIAHNVLVCQDLVRLYGRKNCKPSCMIKINLRKAYDTVEWGFLEEMLMEFSFPDQFIKLIMICIRTPKFSLLLNGSMCGFFNAKRGLRQGDLVSPLLFVLGMEYLSRIFQKVGDWPGFKFHERCSSLKLNHLYFVDDLFVFSHGDFVSIMLMLRRLKLFSSTSGLMPNEQKTAIYCSGMSNNEVGRILEASQFKRSTLPFRYLGIPICSKKISTAECQIILEKMVDYAITKEIEAICRSFLWKGTHAGAGPGLVAWEHICLPKGAGGLGLRNIQKWNIAAMTRYKVPDGSERKLNWGTAAVGLQKLLQTASKMKNVSASRRSMMKTILAALVYQVWEARNDVLWNQKQWQIIVI